MSKDNSDKDKSTEPEVQNELSAVSSDRKRNIIILGIAIVAFGGIAYSLFFSSSNNAQKPAQETVESKELTKSDANNIPEVPKIPPLPNMLTTAPPAANAPNALEIKNQPKAGPPPLPKMVPTLNAAALSQDLKDAQEKASKKRKAGIMLINNPIAKSAPTPEQTQQDQAFKILLNPKYLLTKGKVIEVALETAINTDQPSEIRAIVTRDVFAQDGYTRLIPKGSKIFGTFKNSVDDMYGIISIDWNRIDLATGYSFNFVGVSVDNLGRNGVVGRLDNKYKETITSNVISSAINIGLAQVLDKVIVPGTNTLAATKNQLLAQSLSQLVATTSATLAPEISTTTDPSVLTKINNACTEGLKLFSDNTVPAYQDLSAKCTAFLSSKADQDNKYTTTFTALISALQAASTAVSTSNIAQSASNLTPTQTALQTAVKELSSSVKDALTSKKYTPNITINQGELIRVKVDQDYTFPKKAVSNINLIR
jgi:type IV secretion system protein VirB10